MKTAFFFVTMFVSIFAYAKPPVVEVDDVACRQAYIRVVIDRRHEHAETLLWWSGDGMDTPSPLRDLIRDCYAAFYYNVANQQCDLLKVEDTYKQFKKDVCSYNARLGF